MYEFISSKVIEKKVYPSVIDLDISKHKMVDIYSMFVRSFVHVWNTITLRKEYIDLESIRDKYILSNLELERVLRIENNIDIYDKDIPTKVNMALYRDVYLSGYKVDLCKVGQQLPDNYPKSDMPDLVITRYPYNTDMSLLHTHCVVTINGYIQVTDASKEYNEAYVINGANNFRYGNDNHMGILSFYNLGRVKKIPIKEDMIISAKEAKIQEKVYINTGVDLSHKTVFLSLGGYLIHEEVGVMYPAGDNMICLNLHRLQLLEKYFESRKYVDLSSLGLDVSDHNKEMINVEEFYSDKVLRKWLSLPQSFIIVLDAEDLIFNKIYLRPGKLPGKYITYHDPGLPLFTGYGIMQEYWVTKEHDQYCISTMPTVHNNYTFRNTTDHYKCNVDDSRLTGDTYDMNQPYFLQILSLT